MIPENLRMEILSQMPFRFFPQEFVSLVASQLGQKKDYVIFLDHADIPVWKLERKETKYEWRLGEIVTKYDIVVSLFDSGSIYVDIIRKEKTV